jgi:hypothetical protein
MGKTDIGWDWMTGKTGDLNGAGVMSPGKGGYNRPRGMSRQAYRQGGKGNVMEDVGRLAKDLTANETLHHGGKHVKLDSFGHPVDASAPTGIDWLLANGSNRQSVKDRESQLRVDYDKRMGKSQAPTQAPTQASQAPQIISQAPEIRDNVKAPLDFFGAGDSFGPLQGQMKSQNGEMQRLQAPQVQAPVKQAQSLPYPQDKGVLPQGLWPQVKHGANILGGLLQDMGSSIIMGEPGHATSEAERASRMARQSQLGYQPPAQQTSIQTQYRDSGQTHSPYTDGNGQTWTWDSVLGKMVHKKELGQATLEFLNNN